MKPRVVGRKRTPAGVLIEVRVTAGHDISDAELTEYARAMLDAADIVCAELRARRAAYNSLAQELAAGRLAPPYRDCNCEDCTNLRAAGVS